MMWGNAGRYKRNRVNRVSTSSDSSDTSDEADSSDASDEADTPYASKLDYSGDPQTVDLTRRTADYGRIFPVAIGHRAPPEPGTPEDYGAPFDRARKISDMQELHRQHTKELASAFPVSLWRVLGSVLDQSKIVQNKVLQAVATLLPARDQRLWPKTRKSIDDKLAKLGSSSSRWYDISQLHISMTYSNDMLESHAPMTCIYDIHPLHIFMTCANDMLESHAPMTCVYDINACLNAHDAGLARSQ